MSYTPCNCEAYPDPHQPMVGECYGHNLADCPSPKTVTDPYSTKDWWFEWKEHGCKLKPGESIHA